jgi:succinyl-CoA synthetase beta subunit
MSRPLCLVWWVDFCFVYVFNRPAEVKELVSKMLGNHLVTKQTGPEGAMVGRVMLAESIDLAKELYFAILMDRKHQGPVIVASPKGGMDIEQVAEESPEEIFTEVVDITKGPQSEQTKRIAEKLGFTGNDVAVAQDQMKRLYELFIKSDATMVEVNPFAVTPEGKCMTCCGFGAVLTLSNPSILCGC